MLYDHSFQLFSSTIYFSLFDFTLVLPTGKATHSLLHGNPNIDQHGRLIKKNFTNFKVKGANGTMTSDRLVADSANAKAQSHSGSEAPWSNSKAHRTVEVTSGTFGAKKKLVSGHDGATTTVVNKQVKTNVPNK